MNGLKVCKTDNCIIFQALTKVGAKLEKSWNLYVSKDSFNDDIKYNNKDSSYAERYIEGGHFDCDDTIRFDRDGDLTYIRMRFFSSRKSFDLYINTEKLIDFVYSDKESTILIPAHHTIKSKLKITSGKNLKAILNNPTLKKKFSRAVVALQDCANDVVCISDDWIDYSFYFAKFRGGERVYNGGLIFHKDYNNPEDLSKGKYSVHT